MFGKATFVMDRGYDDNKMFLKLDEWKQDFLLLHYHQLLFQEFPTILLEYLEW